MPVTSMCLITAEEKPVGSMLTSSVPMQVLVSQRAPKKSAIFQ